MSDTTQPVLMMAGGTGGHVFPALACAHALRERGIPVHWLGTQRGLESRLVPQADIPISYLSIWGVRGKNRMTLALAPFHIIRAIWQAIRILRTIRPQAVLSMGGFVAGPGGVAAWLLGIPVYVHEQNAIPGLTNRLLSYFSTALMQAFPGSFPEKKGAITVGNPIRADIIALPEPAKKAHDGPLRVLVFGGSLGALVFNQTLPQVFAHLKQAIQLWHQTGQQHIDSVTQSYAELDPTSFGEHPPKITAFIDDMASAYAWADIVICRSGALTVSELAQAGKAAILVPFPHAVDDHQTANARFLVNAGAAQLLPQPQLNPQHLAELLDQFSSDPEKVCAMSQAARASAQPDAVKNVLKIILSDRINMS